MENIDPYESEWFYNKFYEDIKHQIEDKGEAYMEWHTHKRRVVQISNYLKSVCKLQVTWFEKREGCFSIFAKPTIVSK